MYLLFTKASNRRPQKLQRAKIDLTSLARGPVLIPQEMLDVNDVVTGKRLRMRRTYIDSTSDEVQHLVSFAGGELSIVTKECCTLGSSAEEFKIAGRMTWSCPVSTEALSITIASLDNDQPTVVEVNAESGRIALGLVNGVDGKPMPQNVDDLLDVNKNYPGSWDHFKAFYRFWQVTPEAPVKCLEFRNPSQCAPGRVAAE